MRNILLNPGPANTTLSVKMAQVVDDICPREKEFGSIMESVSQDLLSFVKCDEKARAVLFGGSGTLAVESCLASVVGNKKIVIVKNGAYGERMEEIAKYHELNYATFESSFLEPLDFDKLEKFVDAQRPYFLAVVHSETTSGLLNSLSDISKICKKNNIKIIADCMSSYACYELSLMEVDFIIASSNKNLQGMAGISFVIANEENILMAKYSKSLYLDLKAQYEYFVKNYQMRFTPPVQTLYALKQAIFELKREGLENRFLRYKKNNEILQKGLEKLGFEIFPKTQKSVIITSIKMPNTIIFDEMHDFCKSKGYTIYPGKISNLSMFRVANIGDIDEVDIAGFLEVLEIFLKGKK